MQCGMAVTNNKIQKKVKRKIKTSERDNLKTKKKVVEEKTIDERVVGISFDSDLPMVESTKVEPAKERDERISYLTGVGTQHPVHEMIEKLRDIFINSGFNELENTLFVAESDIFKQYNVRSGLVFNKSYYIGENLGHEFILNPEQVQKLQNLKPYINFDLERLLDILAEYNDKKIEYYQIFQRLTTDLNLTYREVSRIIDAIPELSDFNPKVSNIILRSTMTSAWLTTLAAIMDKENLPIKVFTTGVWFKREPKLNEQKLRLHYGASCIIIDDKIALDSGKVIAEEILNRLGFEKIEFKTYSQTQDLPINIKEFGIFSNEMKIASVGLFSRKVVKKFGIDLPVLYINFGIEHMVMIQKGIDDIRELMYPQFYKAWKLSDDEIVKAIQYIQIPQTELGKEIAQNLVKTCEKNHDAISPCEFTVWEGEVKLPLEIKSENIKNETVMPEDDLTRGEARQLTVKAIKRAKDSKLCGPAFLNEIVVNNGDVYGIQNIEQNPEFNEAVKTGIRYLDAFSKFIGSTIETEIARQSLEKLMNKPNEIGISVIKDMEDINLQLDGRAIRYILTNNKKIDVRGPMFTIVEYELSVPNSTKADKPNDSKKAKITKSSMNSVAKDASLRKC